MDSGRISVIIPVYNRQDVIKECVSSVLKQSYQNFDIVLIDDGSTDKTIEICNELKNTNPKIKLFAINHGGVSAARNKGLEVAEGEYVFFLDSDDVIHPKLFEALINGIKNTDAAIAGTGIVNVHHNQWHKLSKKIAQDDTAPETSYVSHQDTLRAVFTSVTPLNLIGGVMMRRDYIENTRFRTDIYIGEDFYFVYENLIKGANTVFLKQKWYYCRIHEHNSSWDYSYNGFWTRFYRRKLVWESEDKSGRKEYATYQKIDAFNIYVGFLNRSKTCEDDYKKIRKVLKEHKGTILPALSFKGKIRFYLSVYMPQVFKAISKLKRKNK